MSASAVQPPGRDVASRESRPASVAVEPTPVRYALLILLPSLLSACASLRPATSPTGFTPEPEPTGLTQKACSALEKMYPVGSRALHRAVLTFGHRQFVCDGLLVITGSGQRQLALISTLGLVTAVRADPDGTDRVEQITPLFREAWARAYVLRDLRCLFAPPRRLTWAGRSPDGHLVWTSPAADRDDEVRYLFSADAMRWDRLELLRVGRVIYRAALRDYRAFGDHDLPTSIDVNADRYQLELRVADFRLGQSPTEVP